MLDTANFAQKTYNPNKFSHEGIKYYSSIAGRPIKNVDDLVDALKNGEIKPSQVPIDYIEREGNTLIQYKVFYSINSSGSTKKSMECSK